MSPGERKYSDASTLGYAARDVAAKEKDSAIATAAIDNLGSVVRELVHAAVANPLVGILISLITVDVLENAGVIRPATSALMVRIITIAFGVEITIEGAEAISSVLSGPLSSIFGGSSAPPPDPSKLIAPQTQTVVMNPPVVNGSGASGGGGSGVLGALTPLLKTAKP